MKKIIHVFFISFLIIFSVSDFLYGEKINDIIQSADTSSSDSESMFGISHEKTESDINEVAPVESTEPAKTYYAIQLSIFKGEEQANQKVIDLKNDGYAPYIFQSINSSDQIVYAVRIGRYSNIDAANNAAISLEKKLNQPVLVTNYNSLKPADTAVASLSLETSEAKPAPSRSAESQEASGIDNTPNSSAKYLPPATDSTFSESDSYQSLLKKIESLETQMNTMQEEAKVRQYLNGTIEEEAAIREEQRDILEDVDRRYTLRPTGEVSFDLGLSYSHSTYDAIREASRVEDVANHTINVSMGLQYGLRDNLTLGFNIPFKYKYHNVGTIQSKEATGLGDLTLRWQFQPFTTNYNLPTIIINGDFSLPVGPSPYDIQYGEELSTSSGVFSTSIGASISQVTDPVVVFASVSASYPFTVTDISQKRSEGILDEVDQGIGLGLGFGFGAAISSEINFNMSFGYSYSFETTYKYKNAPTAKTGIGAGANLKMGFGYKYYKNYKTNVNIQFPLTSTGSYSLSFNTPIRFNTNL